MFLAPLPIPQNVSWPKAKVGDYYIDQPHPGSRIVTQRGSLSRELRECELPDFAPFRLESSALEAIGNHAGIACDVTITGRTIQRWEGGDVVTVQVRLIGDGEPDTVLNGCMMLVTGKSWIGHYGPDELP